MYYRVGPIRCRILSAGVQPIKALLVQCRLMSRLEAARVLGIEPTASKKEIKKAYIQLAKIYHPDSKVTFSSQIFRSTNSNIQTGCESKFRQLQTASDVLQKLEKIPNRKTKPSEQEIDPDDIVNKFYQKRGFHSKAEYDFYRGEAARAQRRTQAARNSSRYTYDYHEATQSRSDWHTNQKFIWTFWNFFIFTSVIYFVFRSNPGKNFYFRLISCQTPILRVIFRGQNVQQSNE